MRKMLMAALLGGAGLFAFAPDARAQGFELRINRGSARCRPAPRARFTLHFGRARHVHRCVPVTRRVWVPATRTERVFVGYDHCGTPVFRTIAVPCGRYETRTTYSCRH